MRVIVVQKGDTLSFLAKRAYGSYDAYMKNYWKPNLIIIKRFQNEIYWLGAKELRYSKLLKTNFLGPPFYRPQKGGGS